ncbi:MAG: branched chain amino acid aminotransferase, partial [Selenomonadaceae bacterium]|nr:branched chain amino acid aminotransferase [Selenomonadaceae bacterium]
MSIKFVETKNLKAKPDVSKIGFGTHFTDYMFVMDYDTAQGWHDARIVPHEKILLDPANATLHYGQAIFEGLKAYRQGNKAVLFRAKDHLQRLNR